MDIKNNYSTIVEDWYGGYKAVFDLEAVVDLKDWQVEIELPHEITESYGVEVVEQEGSIYTLKPDKFYRELSAGQSIEPVLIVDDGGVVSTPPSLDLLAARQVNDLPKKQPSEKESFQELIDNTISGGILELEAQTYSGHAWIDKPITVIGNGAVIDGSGTYEAIIGLSDRADGSSFSNLTLTNGNNGIAGSGATDLTLSNLKIENIGNHNTIVDGQNNTAIALNEADGLRISDVEIKNASRKGLGLNDTDGAVIEGLSVSDINLEALHTQSHDAAGVKFFNTNNVSLSGSSFERVNAYTIWNDTTSNTTIKDNYIGQVGSVFAKPDFDPHVTIAGIFNEKSVDSVVAQNQVTTVDGFTGYNASQFTTESMQVSDNDFASESLGTADFWVDEEAEKAIAITEDPAAADFSLFADEYFAGADSISY